jgi:hypothetical protein
VTTEGKRRSLQRLSSAAVSVSGRSVQVCLLAGLLVQTGSTRAAGGAVPPAPVEAGCVESGACDGNGAAETKTDDRWIRRFSGRWAMLQVIVTAAELPVVGKLYATTRVVALHDLSYGAQRLRGEGNLCHMEIESGTGLVRTVLPRAFVRSLPRPALDAALLRRRDGWLLEQDRQIILVGARLRDRIVDPLPTRANDPRVVDQDKDGKPGVTIRVAGIVSGEIYVAQRSWTSLSGKLQAPGLFKGRIEFGNEQHILGATSWFLKHPPGANPVPDRSAFHLVRMGRSARCRDALRLFNLASKASR